jgi:Tol biopolymer transport system component
VLRRRFLALPLTLALLGLAAAPASAAPSNDTFSAATVLTGTRVLRTGDSNTGATGEPGEPQHANTPGGASVWYSWTPVASGPATISTAGSSFDTLLGVYVGSSVNALAGVVSNDDDPNHDVLTSVVHLDAIAATTYRIAVDGYAGDQGTLRLRLHEGPPSTARVSISDLEAEANDTSETAVYSDQTNPSGTTALSTDGGVVAFASDANNLISPTADNNGCTDVFVRTPGLGTTARASISDLEAQGNDCSWDPSISGDGALVAFSSDATNLISPTADGNGCTDVFMRNLTLASTQRVSLTNAGGQSNDCSQNPSLSSDGTAVAFESWGTNLTAPSPNGNLHIFVRNLTGATTVQATKTSGGTQGNNDSFDPSISANGGFVAYESRATNLGTTDTNGVRDIYLTDMTTGAITRVSVGAGAAQGDGSSRHPAISGDGRYIAFDSGSTNFVANDTNGSSDVFLHDTVLGTTARISVRSNGTQGKGASYDPQISADGRFVVFSSDATNLVTGDSNGTTDVFLHDTVTGSTTRLSVDSGWNEGGSASYYPSIAGDGTDVAFTSDADNLVATDNLGNTDVFMRPVAFQGDALIKKGTSSTYVGDGVYEATATTQKLNPQKVKHGKATTFTVQIQNDGSAVDGFTALGCASSKGFTVTWTTSGVDVTTAVVAGSYATGAMNPDDTTSLDLTILVSTKAPVGKAKACGLTLTSATDVTKLDAVAAQIKVS